MRRKNKKVPLNNRGAGSGRNLSYPREVDEQLLEWILVRRDSHLPVGTEIIKAKACQLIKPHNAGFVGSVGQI